MVSFPVIACIAHIRQNHSSFLKLRHCETAKKKAISIELSGIRPNIANTITRLKKMFLPSFSSIRRSLGQNLAIGKVSSKKPSFLMYQFFLKITKAKGQLILKCLFGVF